MRKTNRPVTVVALLLAMFMAAMEMTVVSTAMPTVVADLGGIDLYDWVFTAYILASTVTVPLYGKLADLYGRKPVMSFGIALFLAGSIASGEASSIHELIVFRALQGLGAGAMQPIAITVVGDIFDLSERGRMQGLFGAVWGVAGIAGPLLGGLIVNALSWHWIFFVNVPFGILSFIFLFYGLHEQVEKKPHRLDLAGAALLSVAIVSLLAGTRGTSPTATLPVAALAFAAFVAIERRASEPILPLSLFSRRILAVSSAAGALAGGAMYAILAFVPLFVQGVLGGSPTAAGAAITPMLVGWPIASAVSGRVVTRVGFRPLLWAGFAVASAGTLGLALLFDERSPVLVPQVASALYGVGMGLANTSVVLAVAAIGGVIAKAITADASIPASAASSVLGPSHGADLDPALLHRLSASLAGGLGVAFWLVAALCAAAFAASLAFPRGDAASAPSGAPALVGD